MNASLYKSIVHLRTILAGFIMLMAMQSQATHIVGGDMTYNYVGNDTFEISLTIRRDCFNGDPLAQFDDPVIIAIYTDEGKLATWVGNGGFVTIRLRQDDTLNTTFISDCGFIGEQVCVQEATYKKLVRLPPRCDFYTLVYQRCCRNITLNNVVDPLNTGATYTIDIKPDFTRSEFNSSPKFNQWPDIYICANEQLDFDHSATDPDGDSLVYSLCIPYMGATDAFPKPDTAPPPPFDPVIWSPPFGTDDPMGGVPLTIDPETGRLTAIPNLVGQFLVGICVEEYRNGELLSTVRRDFEYNVRVCTDIPEVSFEVDNPICDELTATFNNTSSGVDSYKWNFNFPSEDPAFMSTEESPTFTFPSAGTYLSLIHI